MANLEIDKREFNDLVGKEFDEEKLIEQGSFLGAHWHGINGNVCEVETYPNRPDLLSVEGLARAYRGFFDLETGRTEYQVEEGDIQVEVDESVEEVRPVIGGAVVRGLELNEKFINGLIQLQEKMHETMGRRRDKLAIGLHDLSTVEPPFKYKAVNPGKVKFTPLEKEREMQLGEILEEHEKGKKYSWILEEEQKYPIIEDSEGSVLSFPPIINNQLTEVDSGTEDIFIDVTGKDRATVLKALNILTTALAERSGNIESVEVDGEELPRLEPREVKLDPDYLRDVSGLDLSELEIIERLKMMKYGASAGEKIRVEVPCYRTDVMHEYDLIEDVIIAHRYTNIKPELPEVDQIGEQEELEELAQTVRNVMTEAGVMEAHTYVHSNREDLGEKMEKEDDYVKVNNPLSKEYSALRNSMIPPLLETLKLNKHRKYPQKFFEAADIVEPDNSDVGASNRKMLGFVQIGDDTDFTDARKTVQVLERDLGVKLEVKREEKSFYKAPRSGKIIIEGEEAGNIGEFLETVQRNWELEKTVVGFELDLEKLNKSLKE